MSPAIVVKFDTIDNPMHSKHTPQAQLDTLTILAHLIGIQSNQILVTLLLFAQAFGLGVMMFSLYITTHTLFITTFSITRITQPFAIAALILILGTTAFGWLERRTSLIHLTNSTIGLLLLILTGFWVGLGSDWASIITFFLPISFYVLWGMSNIGFWAQVRRLLDTVQPTPAISVIFSGIFLAIVVSSLLIAPFFNRLGPSNLLLIAIGGLIITLIFQIITQAFYGDQLGRQSARYLSTPAQSIRTKLSSYLDRYAYLIFGYMLTALISIQLLEYAFLSEVSDRYTSVGSLMGFFGNYFRIALLLALVALLFTDFIINRYGVIFGLWLKPMVIISGVALLVLFTIFTERNVTFWLVIITKLAADVFFLSLTITAVSTLYQPLPAHQQTTLHLWLERLIRPIALGAAAGVLLALNYFGQLPIRHIAIALIALYAISMLLIFRLSREYGQALKRALVKRRFTPPAKLMLTQESSFDVVRQAMHNDDAEVVIYALDIIEESNPTLFPKLLPDMLEHPAEAVQHHALQRVEAHRLESALSLVEPMVSSAPNPTIQGTALQTVAALKGADLLQDAYIYLDSTNIHIRQAIMVGLLRYGGEEGFLLVEQRINHLVKSDKPNDRRLAAQTVGEANLANYYQPLDVLLYDRDTNTRNAAIKAAGRLNQKRLWPKVVEGLNLPETRAAATQSLIAGGEAITPLLSKIFVAPKTLREVQVAIARIFGRIDDVNAMTFLSQQIAHADPVVRTEILYSLSRRNYRADPLVMRPVVEAQIQEEVNQASWLLATMADLGKDDVVTLVEDALDTMLQQVQERIFYLLSFLYDTQTIFGVQHHLNGNSSTKRDQALQVMMVILEREMERWVMPLMDGEKSTTARLDRLNAVAPQPRLSQTERLKRLAEIPEAELSRWVNASTLHTIGRLDLKELSEPAIATLLGSRDPLLQETAAQVVLKLDPNFIKQLLPSLSRSLPPTTLQMINTTLAGEGETAMLSTIERVLFLKSVDLFRQFSGEELVWVAEVAQEIAFPAGEKFIRVGASDNCLYIIVTGQVDVMVENGRKVAEFGPKSAIGEMALFTQQPRTATCVAVDPVTVLKIDQEDFEALLAEKSELALGIIRILAERLELANQKGI